MRASPRNGPVPSVKQEGPPTFSVRSFRKIELLVSSSLFILNDLFPLYFTLREPDFFTHSVRGREIARHIRLMKYTDVSSVVQITEDTSGNNWERDTFFFIFYIFDGTLDVTGSATNGSIEWWKFG